MHFDTNGWIHNSQLMQNGGRFVDFFFVLSGFVIAHAYRERLEQGETWTFLWRRIGRLWPLHMATLVAAIGMAIAGAVIGLTVDGFEPHAIPANIMMVQAWGFLDRLTWNGPSWSISTEMFAYGFFALLALWLRHWRLDIACTVVMAASFLILWLIAGNFQPTYDFGIARCLFGFMGGVLAARLRTAAGFRPRGEIAAAILAIAAVGFLPSVLTPLIVPMFAWTILVFASDAGPLSKVLLTPVPQMLGRVSYSIYMDHYLIALALMQALSTLTGSTAELAGVRTVVAPPLLCDALTLVYLAIVVAASLVTYRWIERPGRLWFNQRAQPVPAAW